MNVQLQWPSDIEGLTRATPLSRRNFFMTASAASAAGYTLAAGPVRADAIQTDTSGLTAGDAKVNVPGGEMPVYFARPTGAVVRRGAPLLGEVGHEAPDRRAEPVSLRSGHGGGVPSPGPRGQSPAHESRASRPPGIQ